MLVLTRKPGQTLQIGPDITITVVDIRPGSVQLGIEAPKEIAIRREEAKRQTPQPGPDA